MFGLIIAFVIDHNGFIKAQQLTRSCFFYFHVKVGQKSRSYSSFSPFHILISYLLHDETLIKYITFIQTFLCGIAHLEQYLT